MNGSDAIFDLADGAACAAQQENSSKASLLCFSFFLVTSEGLPIFGSKWSMIFLMEKHIFRVVTRGPEGEYRIRDYTSEDEIRRWHIQTGICDYNLDMSLRGHPIFKGLIGPISETSGVLRYESPEVFEQMAKEWGELKRRQRRKKKSAKSQE
jgi:hypothetical protein